LFYPEVVFPSSGRVQVTCEDDFCSIKVLRGVSVDQRDLPEHLAEPLQRICRAMVALRYRKVEISPNPHEPIFVNGRERADHGLGEYRQLCAFAIMLTVLVDYQTRLAAKRSRLSALRDLQLAVDAQIRDLEVTLKNARIRAAELETQSIEVIREIEETEEAERAFTSSEPEDQRQRDRESARIPRGRHRKARAAK
jgi:hypothetical protein